MEVKLSPNKYNGRSTKITEIAIHHFGSPTAGYTHDGVVKTLSTPARQASAHYVVSAGRVTQLVKESDTSWATGKANPWTISIEIDPKCELRLTKAQIAYSDKVYKTAGNLIKDIRSRHGNLPLVKHRKYMATACPGLISTTRLNNEAGKMAVTLQSTIDKLNKVRAERDALRKSVDGFTKQVQSLKLALANEKNKPPEVVIKKLTKVVDKIVKVNVPVVTEVEKPLTLIRVVNWIVSKLTRS